MRFLLRVAGATFMKTLFQVAALVSLIATAPEIARVLLDHPLTIVLRCFLYLVRRRA
jgi:hypothetical protein